MGQPATRLGDSTSHGGAIISGSGDVIIDGMPAGRLGDPHACPLPGHGANAITSGYTNILINGIPAAAINDLCACGATIVTGSPTVLYGKEHRTAAAPGACNVLKTASCTSTVLECKMFDEQLRIVDQATGEPLVDYAFFVEHEGCEVVSGRTDVNGKIPRVYSDIAENYEIFLGDDALAKMEGAYYA